MTRCCSRTARSCWTGRASRREPSRSFCRAYITAFPCCSAGAPLYRGLFGLHGGELCWRAPLCAEELFFTPRADCSALCYLADTTLGLPDESIEARAAARKNGWDYFAEEIDPALLARLLAGGWEGDDFVTVPAGGRVVPTYTQELFRAE